MNRPKDVQVLPVDHLSHREGREIVGRHRLADEICALLTHPEIGMARGNAKRIKSIVRSRLSAAGWVMAARVADRHGLRINALKSKVGFTLQTGNVARAFYDLLKFQAMHLSDRIDAAVLALPTKGAARALGLNIANFTRVCSELRLFSHIITVPCWVIAIDEEGVRE